MSLYLGTDRIDASVDESNLVHKSGNETIEGIKSFKDAVIMKTAINPDVTPSSMIYAQGFREKDINGNDTSLFASYQDTDGTIYSRIGTIRNVNGTDVYNLVNMGIKSDGTRYTNIPNLVMPSEKYIDLTIGATGTIYTAPADGWVYFCAVTTSNNLGYGLHSPNTSLKSFIRVDTGGQVFAVYIPVKQGHSFIIIYEGAITDGIFKFIYAEGVKPN